MNTLICAGGSGSRVLESLLHLSAMGYGPTEPVRTIVIDPDGANGNASRTSRLAEHYRLLHERLAGRIGADASGRDWRLFGTKFDYLGPRLMVWRPNNLADTLGKSIDYERLDPGFKDTVHSLLTRRSLDLELTVGFQGRPAIGAAAMSLLSEAAGEPPWSHVVQGIESDIAGGGRGPAKVFVVGSVFGGTGASAIHPVVRFLRHTVRGGHNGQLRIGVGALVPYFGFPDDDNDPTALTSRGFPVGTQSAAEFYRLLRDNDDWKFDAMFWLGDSEPARRTRAVGGDLQENPAHFCELLMATACVDFFNGTIAGGRCYYAGPRQPASGESAHMAALGEKAPLDWEDVPRLGAGDDALKVAAMCMMVMAMAHDGFWREIVESDALERQPYCVPWYLDRFVGRSLREADRSALVALGAYFRQDFLRWCREIHRLDRVLLFNRAVFGADEAGIDLTGLPNIRWPNDLKKRASHFDEFFNAMVEAADRAQGETGLARYVAVLACAAEAYVQANYRSELSRATARA